MNKNFALIYQFSKIKIPFWLLVIPIINIITYLIVLKSWFVELTDRKWFINYYRKTILKTVGVILLSILISFLLTFIFIVFINDLSFNKFYLLFALIGFVILINLIYHPIVLFVLPKQITKNYSKYLSKYCILKIDWNNIDTSLISYDFKQTINNIKNPLGLNYYMLFNNDKKLAVDMENADISYLKASFNLSNNSNNFKSKFIFLNTSIFWFFGTLNICYQLFNTKKTKEIIKINLWGYLLSFLLWTINIAYIVFIIFGKYIISDLANYYFFNNWVLFMMLHILIIFFINLIYINLFGWIIKSIIKNKVFSDSCK